MRHQMTAPPILQQRVDVFFELDGRLVAASPIVAPIPTEDGVLSVFSVGPAARGEPASGELCVQCGAEGAARLPPLGLALDGSVDRTADNDDSVTKLDDFIFLRAVVGINHTCSKSASMASEIQATSSAIYCSREDSQHQCGPIPVT